MPVPIYSAGSAGGLIGGVSVAHGATIAAYLDLSGVWEGQVTCEVATGATPPTAGTTFSAYKVYGNSSAITVSTNPNSTTLNVSSASGMRVGQKVAVQQAGGSQSGELATITGISGTTLTVATLANTYFSGDHVYLINQSTTNVVTPSGSASTWAASTDYSAPMVLGTGQYVVAANNADTAQAVTVSASVDKIASYQ